MRYHLLACIACFVLGITPALAQPQQVHWPDRVSSTRVARTQALRMPCARPENTVAIGDTLRIALDTVGGFGDQVSVLNTEPLRFGAAFTDGAGELSYTGIDNALLGGFDTVRVELCTSGGDCRVEEFVLGSGRDGLRTRMDASLEGGASRTVGVAVPTGELFCGSITDLDTYEAIARRRVQFQNFTVGDSVVYQSARFPGIDEVEVVVCNEFGTCDTTLLAFNVATRTVMLPFCEDFSQAQGLPNPALWLDDDVFVTSAYALRPPTMGAATFDGLDVSGLPYGEGYGPSDALTSTYLDASSSRDLYLKYFLQLGGRGQAPEQGDVLIVEARSDAGEWLELFEHSGSRTSTSDTAFTFYSHALDAPGLLHEALQVRFRTQANLNGGFDVWNLDYVRVEEGESTGDFDDIALTRAPGSLLQRYTALPYSQFAGRERSLLQRDVTVGVANLFDRSNNVSDSRLEVFDASGQRILDAALLSASQFNLEQGGSTFVNAIPDAPYQAFVAAVEQASASELRELRTRYSLTIDTDQDQLGCALRNDTSTSTTIIDDYFAYDDGTAESGLLPGGVGEQIAVRYEAFETDTLRGLRFQYPRLSPLGAERQLINLQVYIGELDDEPEYEEILVRPYFPSTVRDTQNAFTTYALVDEAGEPSELVIPAGTFYVGWQQASDVSNPVPVGLDLANDSSTEIFAAVNNEWSPLRELLPRLSGSLMLRPVYSAETLANSSRARDVALPSFVAAPNPTQGEVSLSGLPAAALGGHYQLIDITGRIAQKGITESRVVVEAVPGIYVLRLLNTEQTPVAQSRLVVQ